MNKKVMVFGVFDGFHEGHRAFLTEAKAHGTHLVAVVARDASIVHLYGKLPDHDEIERISGLLSTNMVEDVVMGHLEDKLSVIHEHNPDVIVLGYSQKEIVDELNQKLKDSGIDHIDIELASAYRPDDYPPSEFTKSQIHVD